MTRVDHDSLLALGTNTTWGERGCCAYQVQFGKRVHCKPLAPMAFSALIHHAMVVVVRRFLVIFGGRIPDPNSDSGKLLGLSTFHVLDIKKKVWSTVTPPAGVRTATAKDFASGRQLKSEFWPEYILSARLCCSGDMLYLYGGWTTSDPHSSQFHVSGMGYRVKVLTFANWIDDTDVRKRFKTAVSTALRQQEQLDPSEIDANGLVVNRIDLDGSDDSDGSEAGEGDEASDASTDSGGSEPSRPSASKKSAGQRDSERAGGSAGSAGSAGSGSSGNSEAAKEPGGATKPGDSETAGKARAKADPKAGSTTSPKAGPSSPVSSTGLGASASTGPGSSSVSIAGTPRSRPKSGASTTPSQAPSMLSPRQPGASGTPSASGASGALQTFSTGFGNKLGGNLSRSSKDDALDLGSYKQACTMYFNLREHHLAQLGRLREAGIPIPEGEEALGDDFAARIIQRMNEQAAEIAALKEARKKVADSLKEQVTKLSDLFGERIPVSGGVPQLSPVVLSYFSALYNVSATSDRRISSHGAAWPPVGSPRGRNGEPLASTRQLSKFTQSLLGSHLVEVCSVDPLAFWRAVPRRVSERSALALEQELARRFLSDLAGRNKVIFETVYSGLYSGNDAKTIATLGVNPHSAPLGGSLAHAAVFAPARLSAGSVGLAASYVRGSFSTFLKGYGNSTGRYFVQHTQKYRSFEEGALGGNTPNISVTVRKILGSCDPLLLDLCYGLRSRVHDLGRWWKQETRKLMAHGVFRAPYELPIAPRTRPRPHN